MRRLWGWLGRACVGSRAQSSSSEPHRTGAAWHRLRNRARRLSCSWTCTPCRRRVVRSARWGQPHRSSALDGAAAALTVTLRRGVAVSLTWSWSQLPQGRACAAAPAHVDTKGRTVPRMIKKLLKCRAKQSRAPRETSIGVQLATPRPVAPCRGDGVKTA
eukprot:scaffold32821_cov74-Phaeocystis_antarctica.AAC.2